eukprot:3941253-Amphidinium_carterae.2
MKNVQHTGANLTSERLLDFSSDEGGSVDHGDFPNTCLCGVLAGTSGFIIHSWPFYAGRTQEYFEYTPGILRAYVKPSHFNALTFTVQDLACHTTSCLISTYLIGALRM